jgi:hypothetical protein
MSRRPNLFVIGAAKSGTTSLHDYLDGHPDIYMSPLKEPGYFSPDAPPPRKHFKHTDSLEHYLTLFRDAKDEKIVGESSTYYLYSRQAPGLIHDFEPNAKIVVMLRNPVDMAFSMHGHRFTHDNESIEDFGAALAADEAPDHGGPERDERIRREGTYVERAHYAEQLGRWFAAFPRDQIHVMVFEDFIADSAAEFRRLLEFLRVDPAYRPADFSPHNTAHRLKKGPVTRLVRSVPAQWLRHRGLPAVIGDQRAARIGRRIGEGSLVREDAPKRKLDPQLRERLEAELSDDIDLLSEMLGRDMKQTWQRRTVSAEAAAQMEAVS